ncbi:MAG: metallophosphoesterase family protein [Verrucomicrobiota bacterium]
MRYAILSDIHANQQAWKTFLDDIAGQSIDSVVCLGDIIGYGPMPQVVLDGVRESSAAVVLGNHDAAVCGRLDAAIFNDHARAVIDWTRERLDDFDLEYLSEIPLAVEAGQDILFVHAEAAEPGRFDYVENEDAAAISFAGCEQRLIFCGHTHMPCVFALNGNGVQRMEEGEIQLESDKRYLINVGSAGEPRRPDDLRGRYVIYDDEAETLTYRPLEFDIEAYREDLKNSGLDIKPYFLRASDFANGIRTVPLVPEQHAMSRLPVVPAAKVEVEQPNIVVPPVIRPMAPPGTRVLAQDPLALRKPDFARKYDMQPARKGSSPAVFLGIMLGLVVLAGAAIVAFSSLFGDGDGLAAGPSGSEASVENSIASGGDIRATVTVSAITAERARSQERPDVQELPELPPLSPRIEFTETLGESAGMKEGLFAVWNAQRDFKPVRGPYKGASKWMGKPKRSGGKIGRAFSFNAKDGFSTGLAKDHLVKGKGMSISLWFQSRTPQDELKHLAGTASLPMVATRGGWTIYTTEEALGVVVGDGNVAARLETHLGHQGKNAPWRHVVAVIDLEMSRLRLFKNGNPAGEAELTEFSTGLPASNPLTFGVDPSGEGKFNYAGKIDDVAIWTRPISAGDVAEIFENGSKKKSVTTFWEN